MTRLEAFKELAASVEAGDAHADIWRDIWRWELVWAMSTALCAKQAFYGSLDAARALHESVLPGWGWRVGACYLSDDAFVFPDFNCPEHGERLLDTLPVTIGGREWSDITDVDLRPAGNPARAWLMAILRALIAQEEAA